MLPPLSKLLGLDAGKLVEALASAADKFITTSEDRARLRQALDAEVHRHAEAVAAAQVQDLASARSREVALRSTVGVYMQNAAAGLVVLTFAGLMAAALFHPVLVQNQRLLDMLTGALSGLVAQLFQYWFGSSASAARKQAYIEEISGEISMRKGLTGQGGDAH